MAANELTSNFDETELKNVINQLIEDIINTLIINISTEETCSVDVSGREPTLPGGDEDSTTLSYAPIIVVKDRSDGDDCTSVEEIETVPAKGREPSQSSGHLDCRILSFAPMIVVKDGSDGDGCTSVEEVETVPAEGRKPSQSSGHLSSGLDPGATTLEPLARRRRSRFSTAWSGVKRVFRVLPPRRIAPPKTLSEISGRHDDGDRHRSPATRDTSCSMPLSFCTKICSVTLSHTLYYNDSVFGTGPMCDLHIGIVLYCIFNSYHSYKLPFKFILLV